MAKYNVIDLLPIVETDFKDTEQGRGLLLRLGRNFDELQLALEALQTYENTTGITTNNTVVNNTTVWNQAASIVEATAPVWDQTVEVVAGLTESDEWDEYGVADWDPDATTFIFEKAYLYMPEWMKASWFLDVGAGAGAEVTAPIDFIVKLVQESFTIDGVAGDYYSQAIVTPISTSVPATIANGKISFRALCRGAVVKPV